MVYLKKAASKLILHPLIAHSTVLSRAPAKDWDGFVKVLSSVTESPFPRFKELITTRNVLKLNMTHCEQLLLAQDLNVYKVESVLSTINKLSLPKSPLIYSLLVELFCSYSDFTKVERLIKEMRQADMHPTIQMYNSCLKMYGGQNVDTCIEFFNEMCKDVDKVDSESYHNVIRSCALHGKFKQAGIYFDDMKLKGLVPTQKTYASMLKIICDTDMVAAEELFEELKRKDMAGLVVCTIMLNSYSTSEGCNDKLSEVFEFMESRKMILDNLVFQSMIKSKLNNKDIKGAFDILDLMKTHKVIPDTIIHSTLMLAMCNEGMIDDALEYFMVLRRNVNLCASYFLVLMRGLASSDRSEDIYHLFNDCIDSRTPITLPIYTIALETAVKERDMDQVKKVWKILQEDTKVLPDQKTCCTVLDAYTGSMLLTAALLHLDEMIENSVEPRLDNFMQLLKCAITLRRYKDAGKIMHTMRLSSSAKDVSLSDIFDENYLAFESCVQICAESLASDENNAKNEARELIFAIFKEFSNLGKKPSQKTYRAVMTAHRQNKDLIRLVQVWTSCLSHNNIPDEQTIRVLVESANELGQKTTALAILDLITKNPNWKVCAFSLKVMLNMASKWRPEAINHFLIDLKNVGVEITPEIVELVVGTMNSSQHSEEVSRNVMDFIEDHILKSDPDDAEDSLDNFMDTKFV